MIENITLEEIYEKLGLDPGPTDDEGLEPWRERDLAEVTDLGNHPP